MTDKLPLRSISETLGPTQAAWLFEDPSSQALRDIIARIAPSDAGVLLVGESGTNKELIARYIHDTSLRHAHPFITVNCGAFSEALVEAELFGYENGAFTGAFGSQPGWLEAAHEGTLFLDEIDALPLPIQTKLIRALQDQSIARLGSRLRIPTNIRVICASHTNLEQCVAKGRFRQDLYYHINVVTLDVLALHQRPGDILPLARYFIREYCQRLNYAQMELSAGAQASLLSYGWPGNVRELENVIYRTLLLTTGLRIQAEDLRLPLLDDRPESATSAGHAGDELRALEATSEQLLDATLERLCYERSDSVEQYVLDALLLRAWHHNRYNQVRTAQHLGISRHVVRARLIRLQQLPQT